MRIEQVWKYLTILSGIGGRITIGQCPKDAQLNEGLANQQEKGFGAAMSALGVYRDIGLEKVRMALREAMKPQVIQERGTVFVHLTQSFLSGVGGVSGHGAGAVETMLMISPGSKTVLLVQAGLTDGICSDRMELPLCSNLRGAMREVARQVQLVQASRVPSPAFTLEPLRPGQRTICDSIARSVAEALEQSDTNQIPVTATIRYQQNSDELGLNIRALMRDAADKHARGMDISGAAKSVGEECYNKSFKK